MKMSQSLRNIAARFWNEEDGTNAVEFAIVLPVMLVLFAVIVEGSRIYWNYQSAVVGVRDAVRYVARTTDEGICTSGASGNLVAGTAQSVAIIDRSMRDGAASFLPLGVSVTNVSATWNCVSAALRSAETPVATVQATVNIQLPFAAMLQLFGVSTGTMTSVVLDQSRVYGF